MYASFLTRPVEVAECLHNTKPDEVLQQLQDLPKQLEASLNGTEKAKDRPEVQDPPLDGSHKVKYRSIITKWVDYTNRFGIG